MFEGGGRASGAAEEDVRAAEETHLDAATNAAG
jgi:hypothetical protein